MGYLVDLSKRSGDIQRFDENLKKMKHATMEICEIWESMKQDFSEMGGGSYGERYNHREGGFDFRSGGYGSGYSQRENMPMMSERDWAELQERRRRDMMAGRSM